MTLETNCEVSTQRVGRDPSSLLSSLPGTSPSELAGWVALHKKVTVKYRAELDSLTRALDTWDLFLNPL